MGFASDITDDEAALGFEATEHVECGHVVVARIRSGLFAVKVLDDGSVRYAICDETMVMLYEPARSLVDLQDRFGLRDRRAG